MVLILQLISIATAIGALYFHNRNKTLEYGSVIATITLDLILMKLDPGSKGIYLFSAVIWFVGFIVSLLADKYSKD